MPSSPGRNDPCPCGSGKKYKKCCGATGAVRIAAPATSTRPPPQITPQAARELLAALDLMGKGRLADAE
ncbi:MAG: SEC-C metal-binding domain-containing protein, partial [Rhodocyclaceae bacterium]|nr:SEC-C metal-binding domain-containing protein [Rhodocyclaceae bacterium]